ncbi:MAG TPA: RNA polymerase sigma-70 factor [Frankiaceae bacterium]|nr:RNA polymerase sigma-70 factor [Frankiaceae bacterium]
MSDDARVTAEAFEELRPLLFGIAYRMLGSVAEAEDVVQEAYVRYARALADGTTVESPRAYLSAVTTRLAIDTLTSARARRETYVGEWLPEPLVDDDPAGHAEQADSLSMAFLLLLERLSPVERAVFLLHDVFGYAFDEVADIVGKTPANCRQLAARARRHVAEGRPRFDPPERGREAARRFVAAMLDGDVDGLLALLGEDVVVTGDSGGGSPSWPRPIVGRDKVARLFAGLGRQAVDARLTMRVTTVNGQPGAIATDADGRVVTVLTFEVADGAVHGVKSLINPRKLAHLGAVADVRELWRQRRR